MRWRFPVPRKQRVDPFRGMIGQSGQNIGEPCLRIDVVELGGLDQGVDGGGALATFVETGKGFNISLTRKA